MPKTRQSPGTHFEVIRTYEEFEGYIRAFAGGKFSLLVIVGRPGISKSESIRRAVDVTQGKPVRGGRAGSPPKPRRKRAGGAVGASPKPPRKPRAVGKKPAATEGKIGGTAVLYCKGGQLTPLEFYIQCYKHQHQPIILDDANAIMRKDIGKRLLMSLTDSRPVKTTDYRTTNKLLREENVPTSFQTKSRVCYISNSWLPDSPEAEALEDRAQLVWFEPSAREVHLFTAPWFWDDEIYQYVGSRLHLIDQHSCRLYARAAELKEAGLDWRRHIDRHCYGTHVRLFQELQADEKFQPEEDRSRSGAARRRCAVRRTSTSRGS